MFPRPYVLSSLPHRDVTMQVHPFFRLALALRLTLTLIHPIQVNPFFLANPNPSGEPSPNPNQGVRGAKSDFSHYQGVWRMQALPG